MTHIYYITTDDILEDAYLEVVNTIPIRELRAKVSFAHLVKSALVVPLQGADEYSENMLNNTPHAKIRRGVAQVVGLE